MEEKIVDGLEKIRMEVEKEKGDKEEENSELSQNLLLGLSQGTQRLEIEEHGEGGEIENLELGVSQGTKEMGNTGIISQSLLEMSQETQEINTSKLGGLGEDGSQNMKGASQGTEKVEEPSPDQIQMVQDEVLKEDGLGLGMEWLEEGGKEIGQGKRLLSDEAEPGLEIRHGKKKKEKLEKEKKEEKKGDMREKEEKEQEVKNEQKLRMLEGKKKSGGRRQKSLL